MIKKWTFDEINGTITKMIVFHGIKLRTILTLIVNQMSFIKQLLWCISETNKNLIEKKRVLLSILFIGTLVEFTYFHNFASPLTVMNKLFYVCISYRVPHH